MIARMLAGPCQRTVIALAAVLLTLAFVPGCSGPGRRHEARRVPDRGYIDPDQARELDKVTMPRYVVEPPDELEISIRPAPADWNQTTVVVQQDGMIDLGFAGDVYVVGLSLEEVELKIAQQLAAAAMAQGQKVPQPYRVSARLTNVQSKYLLCDGNRRHPGSVSHQGQRDRARRDPPGRPEVQQPSREGVPGQASSPRGIRPGAQDRLVRHPGARRYPHQLPALPRRQGHRAGDQTTERDRDTAGPVTRPPGRALRGSLHCVRPVRHRHRRRDDAGLGAGEVDHEADDEGGHGGGRDIGDGCLPGCRLGRMPTTKPSAQAIQPAGLNPALGPDQRLPASK